MKKMLMAAMASYVTFGIALTVMSDTVNFTGAEDNDFANSANWSPSSWTSADTLFLSTSTLATFPDEGFKLTANLAASSILHFGRFPNRNVNFDFGGRALNTTSLCVGDMHDDKNRNYYVLASGGFSGVEQLLVDQTRGHIRFTNGVFKVAKGLSMTSWYPYIRICKDAVLEVTNLSSDGGVQMKSGSTSAADFTIDGGKFLVSGRATSEKKWLRCSWRGGHSSVFKILNGGEYVDDTSAPQDYFGNNQVSMTIDHGGFYHTNATETARNFILGEGGNLTVRDSTFKIAQMYLGKYQDKTNGYGNDMEVYANNITVDFDNSTSVFAFKGGSYPSAAGVIMPSGLKNLKFNIHGSDSVFLTRTFLLGGTSNSVAVSGGVFAASNSLWCVTGTENTISFEDCDARLGMIDGRDASLDMTLKVGSGAKVKVDANSTVGGEGSRIVVSDGGVLSFGGKRISLASASNSLAIEDSQVTGKVWFVSNHGEVLLRNSTLNAVLDSDDAFWLKFASGESDNVLIVSNSVVSSEMPFYASEVNTSEGPMQEMTPYVNCPNSRIEFRGENPVFKITNGQRYRGAGNAWCAAAFGEMIDREKNAYTTVTYPLKDPVRLRYVMPKNGYTAAPVQNTADTSYVLLGGNAEFEFDMTNYEWPDRRTVIPLVYDVRRYLGWKNVRSYVNVAGLNATNAERLPRNPNGRKCFFSLSADGTTLNLVVPSMGGMCLIVR